MSVKDSTVLLNYEQTSIYDFDVELLTPGRWINDKIIGFYFDYMKNVIDDEKVFFVNPSVSIALCFLSGADLDELVRALRLEKCELLIIPVSDNTDPNQIVGGTHWSLLSLHRPSNEWLSLDSNGSYNHTQTLKLVTNLSPLLGVLSCLKRIECTQQTNSNDCGMFVLTFAKVLAEHYEQHSAVFYGQELQCKLSKITPTFVANTRLEIKKLIYSMSKTQSSMQNERLRV